MAQEFRVGGNEVLLSLSPEYRAFEEDGVTATNSGEAVSNLLGNVQRFKPFVDYLTAFKAPAECELTTVVIKNVGQIGTRIASVTCDVTLRHSKSGKSVMQPVHLDSDVVPVAVLPVIEVTDSNNSNSNNGISAGRYAVLFSRARLALGARSVLDIPIGFFEGGSGASKSSSSAKPLQVTNGIALDDLAAAGFTAAHLTEKMCSPLSTGEDVVTGYEGQTPIRITYAKRTCSSQDVEGLLAVASSSEQKNGGTTASFVLVPLEDVATRTSDIHAILAASLLL
jgi:hypothetical protein